MSNTQESTLKSWDNHIFLIMLCSDNTGYIKRLNAVLGWACARLGSWEGKSLPSRWSLAVLRGWSATLGLR